MFELTSGTLRRHFLGAAALGATMGLPELAAAAAAAEPGHGGAEAANGFISWLDSIGGKQRQLFDMPQPNQGFGLIWSWVLLLTGPEAFGVPEKDIGVVIVLRHEAIPLALNDAMWRKYRLGEAFKITDPTSKAPAERNFYVASKPGDLFVPEASLDKLMARGAKISACNMALTVYSGLVAKRMGLPAEQVKQEWISGLVPGVQVVPSGVVAINGAQSRGCAYCYAG